MAALASFNIPPVQADQLHRSKLIQQVKPDQCDYLISLDLPSNSSPNKGSDIINDNGNTQWFNSPEWREEHCLPFLDAASTPFWARLIDLPGAGLDGARTWGRYCLLGREGSPYPTS